LGLNLQAHLFAIFGIAPRIIDKMRIDS